MSITIKATETKDILIAGTEYKLSEVYARLEFAARANGTTLEIATATYVSKETYQEGMLLYTDITTGNIVATLKEGEIQSLETAEKYAKLGFEQLGYEVLINI
jgi:urease beta subunit